MVQWDISTNTWSAIKTREHISRIWKAKSHYYTFKSIHPKNKYIVECIQTSKKDYNVHQNKKMKKVIKFQMNRKRRRKKTERKTDLKRNENKKGLKRKHHTLQEDDSFWALVTCLNLSLSPFEIEREMRKIKKIDKCDVRKIVCVWEVDFRLSKNHTRKRALKLFKCETIKFFFFSLCSSEDQCIKKGGDNPGLLYIVVMFRFFNQVVDYRI